MTVVLQKAVTPAQVQAFLNEGFDRIGGYMVRAGEVSDVTAVADLRRLHHTDYEGSPFAGDGPLHILHVDRSPSWQLVPASKMVERDVMSTSGTVEVNEQLVEVLFLDHTRLTNGARLWRFEEGETPVLVATYLGPAYGWQDHSAGGALKTGTPYPSTGALAVVEEKAFVADVISGDDGVPTSITAVAAVDPGGDLGFSQNDVGLWVRAFEHAELSALFELRVTATWNDLPVLVVQVFRMPDGSRAQRIFSIARDWERARAAGLTELELGVWEANVSADEVTNVGPQEVAAQPWMTEKQKERVAKAQAASRQNVLKDGAGAGG
ncbi:MAG TPA: hypothetical protein VFC82_11215, partial [Actinomycetaceae bacterium]|nr:hypothetical protein [Actinomycetaceae bacterium]